MNRSKFQLLVRRILNEEISKRVPEMNGNGLNSEGGDKTFPSDPNSRDTKCKEEMLDEITKAVQSVDKAYTAVWDDHDDIMINGRDILFIRITPLWEDNFKIVFMPRNERRFFFTGLTWEQVIDFIKNNIDKNPHYTEVEKGRDKSWRNNEDQTEKSAKGLPQDNKPVKKEVKDTKNKEKNYNEKQVKNEDDLPDRPMKEVDEIKYQREHKVKDPVRLRKRNPDKKLVIKQK